MLFFNVRECRCYKSPAGILVCCDLNLVKNSKCVFVKMGGFEGEIVKKSK